MGNFLSQPVEEEVEESLAEPTRKTRVRKNRRRGTARRKKEKEDDPS